MIYTLTYVSTLRDAMSAAELDEVLGASRERNAAHEITGVLLVRQRHVMQILEGPEQAVRDLYRRIEDDTRHFDVTTVWTSTSADRRYPDWSMGYEDLAEAANDDSPADPALSATQRAPHPEQDAFLRQRTTLLRRALASGDRLIGALAIILHAHDTTSVLTGGQAVLRCRECRADSGRGDYPCSTASNALWALDAVR